MTRLLLTNFILLFLINAIGSAQTIDSTLDNLQQIPAKYLKDIDKKIKQYSNRVTTKTEKTLNKLSRWETKIKSLVEKANPEAANRLFGNNQLTFASLLEKVKQTKCMNLFSRIRDRMQLNYSL